MDGITITENDELVMKLLHYFVTEQGYNPIILKGIQNEIWLENLNKDYKVIRLVSNYIHNDEQMEIDLLRTQKILKQIKKKTMSFSVKTLSIYVDLGDNVTMNIEEPNIDCAGIKEIDDLKDYEFIMEEFPTITKNTDYKESGFELFMKLTGEIGKVNDDNAKKAEDIFTKKTPYITIAIVAINLAVYILSVLYGEEYILNLFANYGPFVKAGEYYRLLTSTFVHVDMIHLLCNMYALYVIGPQIENFFGKWRYLVIYLGSGLIGSLLSIMFNAEAVSVGASGAIFGLLGSLIYFGYHYRVYLDTVVRSQIIPIIILNLFLGFMSSNIDNAAHIGGLIGGVLTSMMVGVKYKSTKSNIINGTIMTIIFLGFLIYRIFIGG